MCPRQFCRVSSPSHKPFQSETSKLFSSWVMPWWSGVSRTVESLRVIGLESRVNVESNKISDFSMFFLLWNGVRKVQPNLSARNMLPCLSHSQLIKMTKDQDVLGFHLNLAASYYFDGFGCYHFCLTRFRLELMIFFWTSSQHSVQFWECRLL